MIKLSEETPTQLISLHIFTKTTLVPQGLLININVVVQSLSHVFFATPWTATCQASLSFTVSHSLLQLMSIESMMPFNHLSHPLSSLLLSFLQSFSSIRVFSKESVLRIRWPKYWSFRFSINFSNEYSRLISFRIDWLDLLAVQGTLKSLLQCRIIIMINH